MYPPLLSPESLKAVTKERLRLLALFYYISGFITFIMSSFLILYVGSLVILSFIPASEWEKESSWKTESREKQAEASTTAEVAASKAKFEPPVVMFRVFAGMAFLLMLGGWVFAAFTIYTGRCIARRKKRTFVMIMAAIQCIFIPYGTLLGIFTLIGLNTVAAKEEYPG